MQHSLRFIADEGVEKGVVLSLRNRYDVLYVAEKYAQAEDSQVLHLAETEDRILITQDKDFGELVYRLKSIHTGVLLYRLHGLTTEEKAFLIGTVIDKYPSELYGAFTVIQPNNVRIRK